jgi:hypothetical protein
MLADRDADAPMREPTKHANTSEPQTPLRFARKRKIAARYYSERLNHPANLPNDRV